MTHLIKAINLKTCTIVHLYKYIDGNIPITIVRNIYKTIFLIENIGHIWYLVNYDVLIYKSVLIKTTYIYIVFLTFVVTQCKIWTEASVHNKVVISIGGKKLKQY